jgi:hypothetical protein
LILQTGYAICQRFKKLLNFFENLEPDLELASYWNWTWKNWIWSWPPNLFFNPVLDAPKFQ